MKKLSLTFDDWMRVRKLCEENLLWLILFLLSRWISHLQRYELWCCPVMKLIEWLVSSLVFSISQWSRYWSCGHSTLWDWAVDNFPEGSESWSGWSLSNIVCSGLQVVVGDIGGVGGAGTSGAMVAPLISTSPQGGARWAGQIALGSAQVRGWMGGSQGLTTHYRCSAASC